MNIKRRETKLGFKIFYWKSKIFIQITVKIKKKKKLSRHSDEKNLILIWLAIRFDS